MSKMNQTLRNHLIAKAEIAEKIKQVMQQTGCNERLARIALQGKKWDVAEAAFDIEIGWVA